MQVFLQFNMSAIRMCLIIHIACLRLTIWSRCKQVAYLGVGFRGQQGVSEQGRREEQCKVVLLND